MNYDPTKEPGRHHHIELCTNSRGTYIRYVDSPWRKVPDDAEALIGPPVVTDGSAPAHFGGGWTPSKAAAFLAGQLMGLSQATESGE